MPPASMGRRRATANARAPEDALPRPSVRRWPRALGRDVLARSWPSLVAGVTALALILWLAWKEGGYFPSAYLPAGAVALLVLGVLLVLRPPHYAISTQALVSLGALIALAAWMGLSAGWSSAPDTALEDMQRGLVYAGIFGLGVIAAGSGRFARHLAWGVLAVVVSVVIAGLLSRLYPDLVIDPDPLGVFETYRLAYPLDYWNAYGAAAAIAATLALGLGSDPRTPVYLRAVVTGLTVPLVVALYMSLSRGSWLALAVGLLALLALSAHRGSLALSLLLALGGGALALVALQPFPALIDDPGVGQGQAAAGRAYAPTLIAVTLAVTAVQGVVAAGRASPALMAALRRVLRPLAVGALVLVGLSAVAGYLVEADAVERRAAGAIEDGQAFVDRQWDDFMQAGGTGAEGRERLTTARGTRSDLYGVALAGFAAHPLRGEGSGAFEYRYPQERETNEIVRDAHSLYLETLSELGLVGAALLLLFIGSIVVAAIRQRVRPGGLARAQTAAIGAACAVWLAHSAVDWDWQMPAVTAPALLLAASLLPYGRVGRRRRERSLPPEDTPRATVAHPDRVGSSHA